MKCEICHNDYVSLANHVRKSHGVTPRDYRREFNIPLKVPLVDKSLSEHLSMKAKIRANTNEGKCHLETILNKARKSLNYGGKGKRNLPECSTKNVIERNKKTGELRGKEMANKIMDEWKEGYNNLYFKEKYGIANTTIKSWIYKGYLPKRKIRYAVIENGEDVD